METVAFFLPTRKGSQRVKNKNTRTFACNPDGLIGNKLEQLCRTKKIDELILSTNDDECIRIAEKYAKTCSRLKIVVRPDELCLDTTNLEDLISYVPTITDASYILWGHVTTPLADEWDYDKAIAIYQEKLKEGFDSLVSVTKLQNFLFNKDSKLINNAANILWPRTQDLEELYEINHVMFIASKDIYKSQKNRIGAKPFLYQMNKLHSFDIDWEEDFKIAEAIWLNMKRFEK
jgi:N-acylneuraminate cytidylyltransferase